ncbi:hypothetical protein SDC9_161725 [bioreactor metagenome]|uniref:Uncharacterized protein n=1 Tax=bioreactor metagenome TaxID=1076179 RepID=A0A645FJ22_9ZZZZ
MDARSKSGFILSLFTCFLRCDTRNQHRLRLRQIIVRGFAIKDFWFTDDVEIIICADSRKLRGSVQRRMGAKGLVIVEEKTRLLLAVIHCSVMSGINLALVQEYQKIVR